MGFGTSVHDNALMSEPKVHTNMETKHEVYKHQLEQILDHCGLDTMVYLLSQVIHEKAERLLPNWQYRRRAKLWIAAGRHLDSVSRNKTIQAASIHAVRNTSP